MNTDDSRGITADLRVGVRTSLLWWLGAAFLAGAAVAAAIAATLFVRTRAAQ